MNEPHQTPRPRRSWLLVLPTLVVTLGLIVAVEGVSAFMNRAAGEGVWPVLFDYKELLRARGAVRQEGGTQTVSLLDPHLGYEREYDVLAKLGDSYLPGFVIYGDPASESALRIVTLGGSTTDPTDPNNWPERLHQLLADRGVESVVFNGGVSGFSSSQELFKLIRDVLPLAPDVVVTLDGVNDAGYVHAVPRHPMVHPYQERMLRELRGERSPIVMPNLFRAWQRWRAARSPAYYRVSGVNYGPPGDQTDAEQWERNVRMMNACASADGARLICVLQPVLGIGDYSPSTREAELFDDATRLFGGQYLEKLNGFYESAKARSESLDYVYDFTELFAGETEMYRDARHPNADGYLKIAAAVAGLITQGQ